MVYILCADISKINEADYLPLYRAASPERQQRADRCRNFLDSVRCITAEILLRKALTTVFGHWEDLAIARTDLGKPFLADHENFHFSVSHSGRWVALAYGEQEIGLDLQIIDEKRSIPAFARRFFVPEEQAHLFRQEDFSLAFTQIWTAKESYLKYLGTGLTRPLTSFSVFSPPEDIRFQWETLEDCSLCLCSRETDYRLEFIDVKNAPA